MMSAELTLPWMAALVLAPALAAAAGLAARGRWRRAGGALSVALLWLGAATWGLLIAVLAGQPEGQRRPPSVRLQ